MKLNALTKIQSSRVFQGALVCSLGLHGLFFWGLTVWRWDEPLTPRPKPETIRIQKVMMQSAPTPVMEEIVESMDQDSNPVSPIPSKNQKTPRHKSESKEPVEKKKKVPEPLPPKTQEPTKAPPVASEPKSFATHISRPAESPKTQNEPAPLERPVLNSQKTFSVARLSPNPAIERQQEIVPPPQELKTEPGQEPLEPEPPKQAPGPQKEILSGKSTLDQRAQWEPAPRNRLRENLQKTFTIAQALPVTQIERPQTVLSGSTQSLQSQSGKGPFSAPVAAWHPGPPTTEKISEIHNSQPPSQYSEAPHHSENGPLPQNKESDRQQVASKTITGPALDGEDLEALKNSFIFEVRNRIAKFKQYPRLALRRGLEGQPIVHFTITRNGGIQDLRVAKSSGSGILDQAALESVKKGAPFPVIPDGLQRDTMTLQLPVTFTLE